MMGVNDILEEVKKFSLEKQMSVSNNIQKNINKVIDGNISESMDFLDILFKDIEDVNDKSILLLQPEKYMTLGIFLCLNGAKRVYGLNRFIKSEERLSTYYEKLLQFIIKNKRRVIKNKNLSDDEIAKRYNEMISIDAQNKHAFLNRDYIQFSLNEDVSLMPYNDDYFNIVISHNVFETLYHPFQSMNEFRRVMAKDALLYMIINPNGVNLESSHQLMNVLKHNLESYEKSFVQKEANYCNRIQKPDMLLLLSDFSFEVYDIRDVSKVKLSDFDKKEINIHFLLNGEKEICVTSYILKALKKVHKKDSFTSADYNTYAKALDLMSKGKYNAANARLETLKKNHTTDIKVNRNIFYSLYFLKDYDGAITAFKAINKKNSVLTVRDYYYAADAHYNLEQYDKAKELFMAAETLDPKQYLVVNAIGLCEIKSGNVNAGLKKIRQAVNIYPYFSEGLSNIGMALETIDKKRAIEHFKMVLTLDPYHCQSLYSMGRMMYEQEYFEESSKYLKEYCMIDGSKKDALKMYIDCLIKMGLKRTAKQELENMMQKDPMDQFVSTMFADYMADAALS